VSSWLIRSQDAFLKGYLTFFLQAVEDFFEDLKSFENMQGQDVFLTKKYRRDFNFNIHKCNFLRTFTDTMPLKIQSCFGNLQPSYVVP
jgi:hypothetical protein